ncbi:hypothetical protein Bbelb_109950 [Branchiostoma belcheri]|nr:hypothetical protein Bbelb_109950 [Branchiostoma belcheri]
MAFKKYNQHTNEWHNCSTPEDGDLLDVTFAVSCNRRIYLFTHTEMHWYDPREDRWFRKALSVYGPEVRVDYGRVLAMGTKIFWTDPGFFNMLEHDTEADSWSEHPAPGIEDNIEDGDLFVLQNTLHALVNYCLSDDESSLPQQVLIYDRRERIWRELPEVPFGRRCVYDSLNAVARMYLPYLNTSHADTQDAANPGGPPDASRDHRNRIFVHDHAENTCRDWDGVEQHVQPMAHALQHRPARQHNAETLLNPDDPSAVARRSHVGHLGPFGRLSSCGGMARPQDATFFYEFLAFRFVLCTDGFEF